MFKRGEASSTGTNLKLRLDQNPEDEKVLETDAIAFLQRSFDASASVNFINSLLADKTKHPSLVRVIWLANLRSATMDNFVGYLTTLLAIHAGCQGKPAKPGKAAMQLGPSGNPIAPVSVMRYGDLPLELRNYMDFWANKMKSNITATLKQDKVDVQQNMNKPVSYAGLGQSGCCYHWLQMLLRVNSKPNGYVMVSYWEDISEKTVFGIKYLPNQTEDVRYMDLI